MIILNSNVIRNPIFVPKTLYLTVQSPLLNSSKMPYLGGIFYLTGQLRVSIDSWLY